MSRKRNRTRYRKPAAERKAVREEPSLPVQTRNQALKDVLRALDGYSNALAFLGEDSPLISAGTFHRSGLTSQTELLTVTYRENWLAKRIIDMPCEDMTRAWYRLSTSLPEAELHRLKRLEAKHSVKQEIANAIRWARLYGGALALIVIRGEERRLDLPLDTDVLMPGCFQGLLVLDKA
jgi:phage-related protein (TIGR01555 family)